MPKNTHVDKPLTNISVAYMQDPNVYIAAKVFPFVGVQKQSDRYFVYEKEDWFRDDAAVRAPGAESAGGDYEVDSTPTYYCTKYSFHKDITEEDRANADEPLNTDKDATEFVTGKLLLRREIQWASRYFTTSIWTHDWTGAAAEDLAAKEVLYWNSATSTPAKDVKRWSSLIQELTGYRPNTLVIGRQVYDALSEHPDILDRIKHTTFGVLTVDLIAGVLDIPRVFVADAIVNGAKKGQTANMSFIYGKNGLLVYAAPKPSKYQPSGGYTFGWQGLLGGSSIGTRIRRIPLPKGGEDNERIECDMAFDMKLVATDLGLYISGLVQ